jgi:hypothetical protein
MATLYQVIMPVIRRKRRMESEKDIDDPCAYFHDDLGSDRVLFHAV